MLSIKKALDLIAANTSPLDVGSVGLSRSFGRVLAESIISDRDLPPFDRSTMDGFAFSSVNLERPSGFPPISFRVIGESAAGRPFENTLGNGEAVRIMTGACVPVGADTVIRQEDANVIEDRVEFRKLPSIGSSIVKRGTEARKGEVIVDRGTMIDEFNIASAAAFGYSDVEVACLPRTAIISTGSEVVGVSAAPSDAQIRDSNSIMLAGLLRKYSITPTLATGCGDHLGSIIDQIISSAATADLLLITGGVSVGKYDLTTEAIRQSGGEIFFEKVKIKPGKPTVFARLNKTTIFALPGNPMSAFVAFRIFVEPALRQMLSANANGQIMTGIAGSDMTAASGRDTFVPCEIEVAPNGSVVAVPVRSRGSGDIVAISRSNGFAVLEAGTTAKAGDTVAIQWK